MKRKLLSLLLILVLCLSLVPDASADESALLWDNAGLLTQREASQLNQKLTEISQKYQAEVRIVTVDKTAGDDATHYINYLFDGNAFGYGENRDGVLLLLCMDLREYRILSNGFANDAVGSREREAIGDAISGDLSDGEYADAFARFVKECDYYLDGHVNGFPFDWTEVLISSLIIGLVIGLIVVLILKGQLKSVRRQNLAGNYVRQNSMHLTHSSDLYLYSHVTRTRKETSKSSGGSRGGGGSRGVSGGRF